MRRVIKWVEHTYDFITNDYDRIVPVVADEGTGKSTLIMQVGWLWAGLEGTPHEQTVEDVMSMIAWDLDDFENKMAENPERSCIMVHDAARVLSRKKAMHGDQIEVEEDLLDARFGNYLVLLGYQDFDIVPTMLATRRSKNLLRLPKRGRVHGHNEKGIRKRYNDGKWPEPALKDSFPDLEGKDLWQAFVSEDQRRKRQRIRSDDEDAADKSIKELADEIMDDGVQDVVSIHGGHNKPYIDPDLIEIEYGTSGNKAKKTAKLLKKKVDLQGAPV